MQFDPIPRDNFNHSNPREGFQSSNQREQLPKKSNECPHCKDTGIVKERNGSVHTCWKCLEEGKLDVHSKSLPDNNDIKL